MPTSLSAKNIAKGGRAGVATVTAANMQAPHSCGAGESEAFEMREAPSQRLLILNPTNKELEKALDEA